MIGAIGAVGGIHINGFTNKDLTDQVNAESNAKVQNKPISQYVALCIARTEHAKDTDSKIEKVTQISEDEKYWWVYFYPKDQGMQGGFASYKIDKTNGEIVKKLLGQ